MEDNKIYFYNPYDKPFGPLSNLFPIEDFQIGDEKYKNINNYVYNFFGCNASERQIIASTTKQSEVRDISLTFRNKCSDEVKVESLQDGYNSVFKNPELRMKLIETGDKKLLFNDFDSFLGIGEDGKGKNVVGKILMKLRSKINIEDKAKIESLAKEKDIEGKWEAYITYNGLKKIMFDYKNDLTEFIGLSIPLIISKVKKDILSTGGIDKEAFIYLVEKNKVPKEVKELLEDKKDPASLLRERYLFNLRELILEELSVDLMVEYIRSKEMLTDIADWDFDTFTFISQHRDEFVELEDRLINLYNLGVNEELMKEALESYNKRNNTTLKIPSLNEIVQSKEEDVNILSDSEEEVEGELIQNKDEVEEPQGNDLYFGNLDNSDTAFLSPYYYHSIILKGEGVEGERRYIPIKIEGLFYPTPAHYMIVSLLGLISMYYFEKKNIDYHLRLRAGINQSYPLILANQNIAKLDPYNFISNFDYLFNLVKDNYNKALNEVTRYRLEKALSIKFEKEEFRSVLRQTGNKVLIYDDKKDPLLGGERNMVGEVLMMLRERLATVDIVEGEIKAKKLTLKNVTKDNKDLENWVNMRTQDIISSIREVILYLSSLESITKKVIASPDLIEFVINELYTPCNKMKLEIEEITNVPRDFYDKVFSSLKNFGIGPKGITLIWQYIDNILQSALSLGEGDANQTMVILKGITLVGPTLDCYKPKDSKALRKIFNNLQVCSLVAVKNILEKMKGYIVQKYKDYTYSSNDIDFAFSLLYNFKKEDVNEGIEKMDVSVEVSSLENKIFNLIRGLKIEDDYSKYISKSYQVANKILEITDDEDLKQIVSSKDDALLEEYLLNLKDKIKFKKIGKETINKIEDELDPILTSFYLSKNEKDLIIKKTINYTGEIYNLSQDKEASEILQSRINLFI